MVAISDELADPTQDNVYIGHDWGATYGQRVIILTSYPERPENIYKYYVSMGNVMPLTVPRISLYDQNRAFWYVYWLQVR